MTDNQPEAPVSPRPKDETRGTPADESQRLLNDAADAVPEQPDNAEIAAELAKVREELAALNDKYLRGLAEQRNAQQRAARDKAEALRYAEADFARELLSVLDDLERALQAVQEGADATTIGEGVRIVYDQFVKVLKNHQIEPIAATGQPFDPEVHEAMLQQPHPDFPAGTVAQELSRGYRMHERVVRPARVVVSSGPPADGSAAPSDREE